MYALAASIACIFTGVAVSGVWSGINGMTLVTMVTHSTWSFALIGRYDLLLCYYWLVQCISLFKLADETVYFIYMQFVFWWRAIRSDTHNSLVTQFGGKFKFTFNHCSQVTIKEQHLSSYCWHWLSMLVTGWSHYICSTAQWNIPEVWRGGGDTVWQCRATHTIWHTRLATTSTGAC